MTIRTWVGRFCVAGGRVDEEGPWLGSLIRQRPDEEADELYVLVEPASAQDTEYTSQLVDVIAQLYSKDALSLTGALTRSIAAAHEHLRDWNRRSLPEHQVGAGASCLAVRGTEGYLAQVGPSLAYIRSASGELRRLQPHDYEARAPLGMAEDLEPRLTRISLDPGDLVLVASSKLDEIVPEAHIERILGRGADDALPEFYLLCRDRADVALVLLTCFEEHADHPPDFLTRDGGGAGVGVSIDAPAPPAGDATPSAEATAALAESVSVGVARESTPASHAGAMDGDGWALRPRPVEDQVREIKETHVPLPATGVRLRGEGSKPSYKRTTGPVAMPQFPVPRLAIFAVIALAIVGLLAYFYLPGSVAQSREDKFTTLVVDARTANAKAQATGDPGLRRQLLTDARAKLADAAKIHKDNADVASLQSDVTAALALLDAVFEIKDFTPVVALAQQVTGSLSVSSSVVGEDHAYFLDTKGKRVLRVALAGGTPPETILQEGEPAGFITAGRPVQIAWSDQTRSLTIIDDRRQAFAYFSAERGTLPLMVRGADGIGSVDAITSSGGNLYVLDVKQSQVWRYLPSQGGFDSERTALLDQVDLRNATGLAVGQDVYVLDSKQGIRRFVSKAEVAFPLAGIDTPMASPASIQVLPGSNRIVVADRGNKRVVVASADGTFLRQIVSASFTDLRGVSVDEGNRIIYVLNGDTLLQAPFPP